MNETEKLIHFVRINPGVETKILKELIKSSKYITEFNKELPSTIFIWIRLMLLKSIDRLSCINRKWFVIDTGFYDT